jgi:hypothetical protein
LSVGSGPLTITARQSYQKAVISAPAIVFAWQWYYHLPSLAFWVLALVPLVLVKENRRPQAWSIVAVLLAMVLAGRMILNLFSASPATVESFGTAVGTLATAWTIVWLLGPWFRGWVFIPGLALMLAIDALSCLGNFGGQWPEASGQFIAYAMASLALLLPMSLASRLCRCEYPTGWFKGLTLLWSAALGAGGMLVVMAIPALAAGNPGMWVFMVIGALIGGSIAGVLIYLVNLPFLILATAVPFYRQRFLCMWGFRQPHPGTQPASELPATEATTPPPSDL